MPLTQTNYISYKEKHKQNKASWKSQRIHKHQQKRGINITSTIITILYKSSTVLYLMLLNCIRVANVKFYLLRESYFLM